MNEPHFVWETLFDEEWSKVEHTESPENSVPRDLLHVQDAPKFLSGCPLRGEVGASAIYQVDHQHGCAYYRHRFLSFPFAQFSPHSRRIGCRQRKRTSARLHPGAIARSPVLGGNFGQRLRSDSPWGTLGMVAQTYNISRRKQNEYALISHMR
jgi:hypothetical protein